MTPTYGVSASLFGDIPFVELVSILTGRGWRQVELGFRGTPEIHWTADIPTARSRLADAGIAVPSVHISPDGWNLSDPDDTVRATALAAAAACLEPAAAIGAQVVVCHHNAPRVPFQEPDREANMARGRQGLQQLARKAADLGLCLAVENLPRRNTPRPGGPVSDVLELIDGLGRHVGVCVDAGHSNANGCDAAAEARLAGSALLAVHIQDSDGLGEDQHWMPGDGTTDWADFIKALDEAAPGCVRTFEVAAKNEPYQDVFARLTDLRDAWLSA